MHTASADSNVHDKGFYELSLTESLIESAAFVIEDGKFLCYCAQFIYWSLSLSSPCRDVLK